MGLIDQMKYAKIQYLADVLEDIQNEMRKDYRCHNYADSIYDIVKDLRETIACATPPNEMECEQIEIKRLEHNQKFDLLGVKPSELEDYEKMVRHDVENRLLDYIRKNKLIRVRRHEDKDYIVTFTASLLVGIEKQPYIPEQPRETFVDNLAKYLDETKQ